MNVMDWESVKMIHGMFIVISVASTILQEVGEDLNVQIVRRSFRNPMGQSMILID